MSDPNDKKLINDEEWVDLLEARYQAQGRPVDDVSKARTWKKLEQKLVKPTPRRLAPWAALAAGLLAVVGVTHWLNQPVAWREKGQLNVIPVNLTPYRLSPDGSTTPLSDAPVVGDTIVFRAHASQNGVYAVIIREDDAAPRVSIQENTKITNEETLLTKSGSIYAIHIEAGVETTVCVIAMPDAETLAKQLQTLPPVVATTATSGCVVLEAASP